MIPDLQVEVIPFLTSKFNDIFVQTRQKQDKDKTKQGKNKTKTRQKKQKQDKTWQRQDKTRQHKTSLTTF